jgi:hypothetical protein
LLTERSQTPPHFCLVLVGMPPEFTIRLEKSVHP